MGRGDTCHGRKIKKTDGWQGKNKRWWRIKQAETNRSLLKTTQSETEITKTDFVF